MNVTVSYYGLLTDRRGTSEETCRVVGGTVEALYRELDAAHGLGLSTSDLRAAVNDEFVSWEHVLIDGDRVAFLPPMSGG